jgi:hypothetical protein
MSEKLSILSHIFMQCHFNVMLIKEICVEDSYDLYKCWRIQKIII